MSPLLLAFATLDLSNAMVDAGEGTSKAASVLIEEAEKRSGTRWKSGSGLPSIRLAIAPGPAEGYRIRVTDRGAEVIGSDARGILYGAGRLLRLMQIGNGAVRLESPLSIDSRPAMRIRGHQLGNRPINNTVDAWTPAMWDQQIRDLAVFGTNAVELIPPQAFTEESPHFRLPPLEMMGVVSRMLADYSMDVWIWFPALDKDYSDEATVANAVKEWAKVFTAMQRVDAVFVPGGDPGHTHPKHLFPMLDKQAASLRRHHPKGVIWVSPQGFDAEWLEEFYQQIAREPAWFGGVVHGPGVRVSLAELRRRVPKRYPIRTYPDVTHALRSQYPVPNIDPAFALTLGREPVNPRPRAYKEIFESLREHSDGFITYSDGSNDDVNKILWSALGWNPAANAEDICREYGSYFIGFEHGDAFAQGLLALENNWRGPLIANHGVDLTLDAFRAIERGAGGQVSGNWRFQQALLRAYYDAYVRNRLIRETTLEAQAREQLESAPAIGSMAAVDAAARTLAETTLQPAFQHYRKRIFELGAALYESIGMQTSVALFRGTPGRGTVLDTIDTPLNDRAWLEKNFARIRENKDEASRLKQILEVLNWRNPGPGGFYDDLGDPSRQPRFVQDAQTEIPWINNQEEGPLSWSSYANSSRRGPVKLRYTGLDPRGRYRVRAVYGGDPISQEQGIRCLADGTIVVHPYIKKPLPIRPVEFDIPEEATRDGELTLTWDREPAPPGRSRGAQVAEVWLIKK
jgi:hypothetical protein